MTYVEMDAPLRSRGAGIARQLPAVLRAGAESDGPMAGLLDVMAALVEPRAAIIDVGSSLFEPLTAPERLLPWLAHWRGHGWLFTDPDDSRRVLDFAAAFPPGVARLRQFLAAWPVLQASRGAAGGLLLTLESATGLAGFSVDEQVARRHLHVVAPSALTAQAPWLRRLIAFERPAHLTWSLAFADGESKQ